MEEMTGNSDEGIRRNRPGTKSKEMNQWPDLDFDDMDSVLCVQQLIQQRIKKDPSDVQTIIVPPPSQDEDVWKYEHIRQFCQELNGLAVLLQTECNPSSCPQMMATEQWIYLCAAHKTPKECPAIDYTRHTLDGAAVLLNSNKYFSSRVTIKDASVAKLASVCRRLYRIFSHAFYHHRSQFDVFEAETFLCERFTAFVKRYELMTGESLIVTLNSAVDVDSDSTES